jgi:hypothetical protein
VIKNQNVDILILPQDIVVFYLVEQTWNLFLFKFRYANYESVYKHLSYNTV